MVKNIIFDLGNVLINFQPVKYLQSLGLTESEVDFIHKEIYLSEEWVELDRGTLTKKEALSRICERNENKRQLLENHSDFMKVLTPIESNTSLLQGLKEQGFRLYYLTNYHDELFTICFNSYDFFRNFEGGVVSAHIKFIKPQPQIFKALLEKFSLNPEESLFIDDSLNNTLAAEKLGIQTIHLEEPALLKMKLDQILLP